MIISLFIVSLVYFSSQFSRDNSIKDYVSSNPAISKTFSNLSKELNESSAKADTQKRALEKESSNPIITQLGFVFNSILSLGSLIMNTVLSLFTSFFTLVQENLGISPIVTGTLLAIAIFTVVLLAWRNWRAGE